MTSDRVPWSTDNGTATLRDWKVAKRGNGDRRGRGEVQSAFGKVGRDRPPLPVSAFQTHGMVTDPAEIDRIRAREQGISVQDAKRERRKAERKVKRDYLRRTGRAEKRERKQRRERAQAMKDAPTAAQILEAEHYRRLQGLQRFGTQADYD